MVWIPKGAPGGGRWENICPADLQLRGKLLSLSALTFEPLDRLYSWSWTFGAQRADSDSQTRISSGEDRK